jgi:hypothetical protein
VVALATALKEYVWLVDPSQSVAVPVIVPGVSTEGLIVTVVVVVTDEHPPEAGVVYIIVYVPGVLVDGVMAPVEALKDNPVEDEYVPPVYEPVPVNETD